jgi:signal transduction histidine kinase
MPNHRSPPVRFRRRLPLPLTLLAAALASASCGGGSSARSTQLPGVDRITGQTTFASAPPYGASGTGTSTSFGAGGAAQGAADHAGTAAPSAAAPSNAATSAPRTVQETDLYRLDGNRLYYLNSYRGLMVFDVSIVDQPKLLGRSAIFGTPVQMFVNNGIAVVVVADWYGALDNGEPFHGSIVRGLDATDPSHITVLGDAKLGGWVQDTRIVGNVLYAVSEDYGWVYGWETAGAAAGGVAVPSGSSSTPSPDVIVSSVSFANGQIQQIASKQYPGYGGVFNVTPNSIMLAHPVAPAQPNLPAPAKTALQYLDISDPGGNIVERGSIEVDGSISGWGADNGRWNLDFADGKTAHVIGCAGSTYGCGSGYVLATADFTNPDQPQLVSELPIASTAWNASARFDSGRMYLSPSGYYSTTNGTTPLEIFDLSNPAAPTLAGLTPIPGSVWLMIPSGNQLFALGQDNTNNSSQVSLKYLDVTNPAAPALIGTSNFGNGWAWTPAAQTFKAFTRDPIQGLVVLPFSGWSPQGYNNGVQLIEFTPTSIATAGAAHTTGWVERGIFANGRILSLSDLALSVVDYHDRLAPTVTAELTLARNVIAAQPSGSTVAEISSDWWGNDVSHSDVRVLPIADAAENFDQSQAPDVSVPGVDARVFTHGSFTYVVTSVQVAYPCPIGNGRPSPSPGGQPSQCNGWREQVEVVDLSNGGATARGTIALPIDPNWYWYWGWGGFYAYDWYEGGEIAQVAGGDALAFEHFSPAVIDRRERPRDRPDGKREADRGLAEWTSQLTGREEFRLLEIEEATEQRVVERDPGERNRAHAVLVVEDTPDVVRVIHMALREHFRVLAASDGKKGFDLAARELPSLIISDLMMPEVDGLELTRRLRSDPRTRHIPIVMLTARADLEDRIAGLETGVNAYLAKPFAARELLSTVWSLLGAQESTADILLSQKMDSLEVVAGALAHEINNPLNYIKGSLDLVASHTDELFALAKAQPPSADTAERMGELPRQIGKFLEVAESGVKRIGATVALMRRYSREGYSRAPQPYDAFAAARDVVSLVAPATGRDVSVETSFEGTGFVECVPEEFNQLLANLVQNAIEAAPEGGGCVRVHGRCEDGWVLLSVADNGPGIKPEDHAKIFTPFFTTKGPGRAMGMGLAIAQRVAASAGGTIRLKSQLGAGAEFLVRLPRMRSSSTQAAMAPSRHEQGAAGGDHGYARRSTIEPSSEEGA